MTSAFLPNSFIRRLRVEILLCGLRILFDLISKRPEVRESLLVTQSVTEAHAESTAVEVALPFEQVDFQKSAGATDRWSHSQVSDSRECRVLDDRVDNVDRDEDDGDQVQQQPHQQHHQHHQQQPDVESEAPQPVVVQQPVQPAIDENTPQPVFDETPAEVQIEQEAASGEGEGRTPRRRSNAGRPRRQPRQPREGKATEAEAAAPVEEPAE